MEMYCGLHFLHMESVQLITFYFVAVCVNA
jgi:hypothetical protein